MKFKYLIFITFIYFFTSKIVAQTIAIVDIQKLIDNNETYIITMDKIELNQKKYLENFKIKENELKKKLEDIENSKILLNDKNINKQIDDYNNELSNFSLRVDKFNAHFQSEISKIRERLLNEIIILLEKYALDNKIDLILDATSYLIASNSLDITDFIKQELNKKKLKLEYKNFE